jgi:hypothetical protein
MILEVTSLESEVCFEIEMFGLVAIVTNLWISE